MKVQPGLYRPLLDGEGSLSYVTSEEGLRVIVEFDEGVTMIFPVDITPRIPQEIIDMFDRKPEVDVLATLTEDPEDPDLPPSPWCQPMPSP